MAEYDVPAVIGAVRRATSAKAVVYIGHSQGTAILFAALVSGWVSPADVALFVALAPPVRLAFQRSPLMGALAALGADKLLGLFGGDEFTLTLSWVNSILDSHFGDTYDLLKELFGASNNLDGSNWRSHFPAPTSSQNVAHWVQEARSGDFAHFKPHFWSSEHKYDMSNMPRVPTVLYYGGNDLVADSTDVEWLADQLDDVGALEVSSTLPAPPHTAADVLWLTPWWPLLLRSVRMPSYAHMDFTWSVGAASVLYPDVLDKVSLFANQTTTSRA